MYGWDNYHSNKISVILFEVLVYEANWVQSALARALNNHICLLEILMYL